MADIDLSVQVRQSGVQGTIASVNALRNAGVATGNALTRLAQASVKQSKDMTALALANANTTVSMKDSTNAARADAAAKGRLTQQLQAMNRAYAAIAVSAPHATASQRLAMAGGAGGISAGIMQANQALALNGALTATYSSDMAERGQLEDARAGTLGAQANLQAARDERELGNMTAKNRSQVMLTRATAAYSRAVATSTAAIAASSAAGRQNLSLETARTAALHAQAQAYRAVSTARVNNASAIAAEASGGDDGGNAFQSSYSYFILAGLATQASQAIFGVGIAAVSSSAEIERSFADVERTFEGTGAQLDGLKKKMVDLSTETPISQIELDEIATLGNQLGVQAADIENFTEVISEYTTVSGQSAEDAATAFGRISNLTGLAASQYGNLASAITYTARTTVATEATIQNTAKEITALSSGAGFSAKAIVGLAGALSSLAIPPERARGALSLYFGALNGAVAEGGPKLQAFAELTSTTADNLERLVRENRGQEVFTKFISGLSNLDTVAKTTALDTLGLSTIRVDQTMRALSGNVPLVTKAFEGANRAFEENTEIAMQFGIIQDTLDSKFDRLRNAIQNASGALGDKFAPLLKTVVDAMRVLVVAATDFSNTKFGQAFLRVAGSISVVIGAIAALLGVLALAKASMVVLGFAIKGLGWGVASKGILGLVLNMFALNTVNRKAAWSMAGWGVVLKESTSAMKKTRAAMAGIGKATVWLVVLSAGLALVTELGKKIDLARNPSKKLTDDLSGLADALKVDNPRDTVGDVVEELSNKSGDAVKPLSDFNRSIMAAIEAQKEASGAIDGTNDSLDGQRFALGDASKAWIEETLKEQDAIKDILDGRGFWEEIWEDFSTPGSPLGLLTANSGSADSFITQDQLLDLMREGMDINALSQVAVEYGEEVAITQYKSWVEGFRGANPMLAGLADIFGEYVLPGIFGSVVAAHDKVTTSALLSGESIADAGKATSNAAEDFNDAGEYIGELDTNTAALTVTFTGITNKIDDFRDALKSAMGGFVGFDSVMKRAQDAAKIAADALVKGTEIEPIVLDVTVEGFQAALVEATDEAKSFRSGMIKLASTGTSAFTLQLAELGPEAAGILAGALALGPDELASIEADARFAAFLASESFTQQMKEEMESNESAYAQIYSKTGDLGSVRDFIDKQVDPDGDGGLLYELDWALKNPDKPLNILIPTPTDNELDLLSKELSGRVTITPNVFLPGDRPAGLPSGQRVTDNETGSSLELPAEISPKVLADSISAWFDNQDATPEELNTIINEKTMSESIREFVDTHGPIQFESVIKSPSNIPAPFSPSNKDSELYGNGQHGGGVGIPGYANGGRYLNGAGNGTSDSILARVANGEYINTAASTNFWGPDFFESLNRNMLPTSFLNMLGAAASGGGGPQSVTNVNVNQINPLTRDPLKQLRESSEMVAAGIWS